MVEMGTEARAERLLRELLHLREAIQTLLQPPRVDPVKPDRDLLSSRQGHALYIVYQTPTTMGELAQALRVPPTTATVIADGLVALGMAKRARDTEDRRLVRLTATARGVALIRDRNRWEHPALAALETVLLAERPGLETQAAEALLKLVEDASAIAAGSAEAQPEVDRGGPEVRLGLEADLLARGREERLAPASLPGAGGPLRRPRRRA